MKRYMMTMMIALLAWTGMHAMDYETARERAYYLTDKMAYELNLNDQQYNDAYEINLDYLLSINTEADLADARYLAYRNNDLRHILYDWQWTAFAAVDYLFHPLYWLNGGWYFPVFRHYAHGYYFYHRPRIFWDYRGGHGRHFFAHGFYHDRRPQWHGGLRGEHRSMIGHPTPGGRYGVPDLHSGHRTFDMRSGRFDNRGTNRPGNNSRNYNNRGNHGSGNNIRPDNNRGNHDNSFRNESLRGTTRGNIGSITPGTSRESSLSRESSNSRISRQSSSSRISRQSSNSRISRSSGMGSPRSINSPSGGRSTRGGGRR